jgi:hypothetical protein
VAAFAGSAQLKDRLQSAQLQKGETTKRLALICSHGDDEANLREQPYSSF